jgi:hypothetical protein
MSSILIRRIPRSPRLTGGVGKAQGNLQSWLSAALPHSHGPQGPPAPASLLRCRCRCHRRYRERWFGSGRGLSPGASRSWPARRRAIARRRSAPACPRTASHAAVRPPPAAARLRATRLLRRTAERRSWARAEAAREPARSSARPRRRACRASPRAAAGTPRAARTILPASRSQCASRRRASRTTRLASPRAKGRPPRARRPSTSTSSSASA